MGTSFIKTSVCGCSWCLVEELVGPPEPPAGNARCSGWSDQLPEERDGLAPSQSPRKGLAIGVEIAPGGQECPILP